MPSRLSTPVLTVDTGKIHYVDTASVQSLHGMWMVFSKCADYMEEGRRLENLSWRLWTRETFCVEPETAGDTSVLPLLRSRSEANEVPELSASVESAASESADRIESHINRPKGPDYKPAVREDFACSFGRAKEKHITSSGLERMVLNIKEKKNLEPFSTPIAPVAPSVLDFQSLQLVSQLVSPTSNTPTIIPATKESTPRPSLAAHPHISTESCSTTAPDCNDSDVAHVAASDTSVSSSGIIGASKSDLTKSPSVVRGFSPTQISSYRSQPKLAPEPMPAKLTAQGKPCPFKKKGGMFTLGGSSGDDDESSFEDRMNMQSSHPHHRSSLSEELGKPNNSNPVSGKKTASFRDQVMSRTIKPIKEGLREDEDALETDDEDVSESAIEDDEDSDWEDSVTESGRSSVEEKELFQRVDSRPNLVSRRSLLTMMMHQPPKMQNIRSTPALQRSRLTSPDAGSALASDDEDDNLTMRRPDVPRSKPIGVKPPTSQQSAAHSPRTTRRNMLATELTESLRRHLLWERQQKSATANAYLKRRHTAHDMANLQQYPGPKNAARPGAVTAASDLPRATAKDKDLTKNSWANYNDCGPWEYHVKGW